MHLSGAASNGNNLERIQCLYVETTNNSSVFLTPGALAVWLVVKRPSHDLSSASCRIMGAGGVTAVQYIVRCIKQVSHRQTDMMTQGEVRQYWQRMSVNDQAKKFSLRRCQSRLHCWANLWSSMGLVAVEGEKKLTRYLMLYYRVIREWDTSNGDRRQAKSGVASHA